MPGTGNFNTTTGQPQFERVSAMVYLNRGPTFNTIDEKSFFTNALGTPMTFEIHQSINGMYRYGQMTFSDRVGIRETLPLTGNEILTIRYKNNARGDEFTKAPKVIHFNIYDMEEVQTSGDSIERFTDKAIKFHVIEAPFFLQYNGDIWMKSYGTPENPVLLHTIFNTHFSNDIQLNPTFFSLNIQKMSTSMHYCSPAWKSQTSFNYLLQYARDEKGYGNVKLYNTTSADTGLVTVNLQSLNQMFSTVKATEYELVDTSVFNSSIQQGYISKRSINYILSYKFLSYNLTSLSSGFGGAHMLNYDYLNSTYFTLNDTYTQSNSRKENPYFANFGLWSDDISSTQLKRLYVGPVDKKLAQGYLNNKIVEHQYQLRCEVTTYIDETINPGDKITIYFMSGMAQVLRNQGHLLDEQMSGSWIIEDMIDSTVNGLGYRKMVLIKDSFFNLYDVSSGVGKSSNLPTVTPVFTKV